jgi:hypothetical protein
MLTAAVLNNPSEMVRQMALPLVSEYRTERALEIVARETGLTYSKAYNLYYRRVKDVWRSENQKLTAAFKRFAAQQARLYRDRAESLSAVTAEIERMEGQIGIDLASGEELVGRPVEGDRVEAS